jgi:hypothetical protein
MPARTVAGEGGDRDQLVTADEERDMDTADFGLGRLRIEGCPDREMV